MQRPFSQAGVALIGPTEITVIFHFLRRSHVSDWKGLALISSDWPIGQPKMRAENDPSPLFPGARKTVLVLPALDWISTVNAEL